MSAMILMLTTFLSASVMADCGGIPCPAGTSSSSSTGFAQQEQVQVQSTASGVYNSGNSGVSFKDSFNGAEPIRYLPNASGITYTGMAPQMFSRPSDDNGANFIRANNMIGMIDAWSVDDLADEDFEVSDVEIDITTVGKTPLTEDQIKDTKVIHFAIQGSETQLVWKENRKVIAMGGMQAGDKAINSVELFMTLAVKAKQLGATAVVIMGEGVKINLKSFGWGVGFSYNMAKVDSDPSGTGSVGAGGTGFSGGTAGYTKMPYLTFSFLY